MSLRVVSLEPVPRDDPRLDDWGREVVTHLQAIANAHRAIAENDSFQLACRAEHEAKADDQERLIARFVARQARRQLAVVPEPETGPFVYELAIGHGLTQRASNALARAGYRTIEQARTFLAGVGVNAENEDLPDGIGVGIVAGLRAALDLWDFDVAGGDDGEIA